MDHLNTFGKLFSQLIGGEEWKKWVQEEKQKGESSLIEELKPRLEKKEKGGELEAISIGMELERKAIEFFENSAKDTKDQKAKEIFNRIADEERFHYDLLQAQYDSVNNSGFWLDVAEFKMDSKF
jgi:rubrerythrin